MGHAGVTQAAKTSLRSLAVAASSQVQRLSMLMTRE